MHNYVIHCKFFHLPYKQVNPFSQAKVDMPFRTMAIKKQASRTTSLSRRHRSTCFHFVICTGLTEYCSKTHCFLRKTAAFSSFYYHYFTCCESTFATKKTADFDFVSGLSRCPGQNLSITNPGLFLLLLQNLLNSHKHSSRLCTGCIVSRSERTVSVAAHDSLGSCPDNGVCRIVGDRILIGIRGLASYRYHPCP